MIRSYFGALVTLLAFPSIGLGTASALTMDVIGLGLDFGGACLSTSPSCSAEWEFALTPTIPVTGTLEYTSGTPGSMDIELDIADFSITGLGPDGVEEIAYSGLHISISSWPTFEIGSDIVGLGFGSATLTGSSEQLDGIGGTVVAPTALNEVILASGLTCLGSPAGQCGFLLTARDLQTSVGTSNAALHDVQFGFNLLMVPEPSTGLLVGLGLAATVFWRRRAAPSPCVRPDTVRKLGKC